MLRSLKPVTLTHCVNYFPLFRNVIDDIRRGVCNNFLRTISSSANCQTNRLDEEEKKKKRVKTLRIPKITLINLDQTTTVCLLEEAQRMAKRRNLQLTKMLYTDGKSDRDVYKLSSNSDYEKEESDSADSKEISKHDKVFKSLKLFPIQARISDHDLNIKINNINKLLSKKHRIKIIFNYTANEEKETVEKIKKNVQGILKQVINTASGIVLQYNPAINNTSDSTEEDTMKN